MWIELHKYIECKYNYRFILTALCSSTRQKLLTSVIVTKQDVQVANNQYVYAIIDNDQCTACAMSSSKCISIVETGNMMSSHCVSVYSSTVGLIPHSLSNFHLQVTATVKKLLRFTNVSTAHFHKSYSEIIILWSCWRKSIN